MSVVGLGCGQRHSVACLPDLSGYSSAGHVMHDTVGGTLNGDLSVHGSGSTTPSGADSETRYAAQWYEYSTPPIAHVKSYLKHSVKYIVYVCYRYDISILVCVCVCVWGFYPILLCNIYTRMSLRTPNCMARQNQFAFYVMKRQFECSVVACSNFSTLARAVVLTVCKYRCVTQHNVSMLKPTISYIFWRDDDLLYSHGVLHNADQILFYNRDIPLSKNRRSSKYAMTLVGT